MIINFQEILDQYIGNLTFKSMTGKLIVNPDEILYMIETDKGTFYILETDYLEKFDDITNLIKARTENFSEFVEAKNPPQRFEDTSIAKYYKNPKFFPQNFDSFKKYVTFRNGSNTDCLTFLIKSNLYSN